MAAPVYPRLILSMRNLAGGMYGTLDILARDRERCELAMGEDFLELSPDEVRHLIKALGEFLEGATGVRTSITEEVSVERSETVVMDNPAHHRLTADFR